MARQSLRYVRYAASRTSSLSSNIKHVVDLKGPEISLLPQAWELGLPAMDCAAVLKSDAPVVLTSRVVRIYCRFAADRRQTERRPASSHALRTESKTEAHAAMFAARQRGVWTTGDLLQIQARITTAAGKPRPPDPQRRPRLFPRSCRTWRRPHGRRCNPWTCRPCRRCRLRRPDHRRHPGR